MFYFFNVLFLDVLTHSQLAIVPIISNAKLLGDWVGYSIVTNLADFAHCAAEL